MFRNSVGRITRALGVFFLAFALVACGGGGGSDNCVNVYGGNSCTAPDPGGDDGGTDGGVTQGPTVTLAVSSPNVTPNTPATLTVTVRNASGSPVAGVVVALSTARNDIGQLSAVSVLTDANGMGSVAIRAAASGVTGADEILAVANLGTTTIENRIGFSVSGATATLQVRVATTTLRASTGPVVFSAEVRDAAGVALPGQIVSFASSTGVTAVSEASSLTDSNGVAQTTVRPVDGSVGVADTLLASTTVNGRTVQSSVNVQVVSETPSIALNLSPSQVIGSTSPGTVQALVKDAAGRPVANAVVSFSTQFGLGRFNAVTAATAAGTGAATVVLSPRESTTTGADVVVATVTVGGVTKTAQRVVEFVGSVTPATPTLAVALDATTITPLTPTTVRMTLLDGSGRPVPGAVVSLSTARGNLAILGAASALTGVDGVATVALRAGTSGIAGADEVIATGTVGTVRVQGSVGFNVSAAAPRISLTLLPDQALTLASTTPATLQATVLDEAGRAVVGQLVRFDSANSLVNFSPLSAVTKADGVASVQVVPRDASVQSGDLLRANAVLSTGVELLATKSVDIQSVSPVVKFEATAGDTSSLSAPAQFRATVTDIRGNAKSGVIVRFSTQLGLGAFSTPSAVTDASGIATVSVSPSQAALTAADTVVASTTVDGVAVTGTAVVRFVASSTSGQPALSLTLDKNFVSSADPATVEATVRDSAGNPVLGRLVTFSVVRGLGKTDVATALTTSPNGTATVRLFPTNSTVAGADEITASAVVAGTTVRDTQGFTINATNVTLAFRPLPIGFRLAEYAQTTFTLDLTGADLTSPVNVNVSSSCLAQGKATLSPATFTATTSSVLLQYRDNGCGAIQGTDDLLAVVVGSANTATLSVPLSRPGVSSVAFVQAVPERIYLRGSGDVESSIVRFEVRDAAGNPLQNEPVRLVLLTGAGGVTMEGLSVNQPFTAQTDATGRVSVRVNSGTVPTPVRVQASITLPIVPPATQAVTVSTVSSNLSVGVGLPSQLNFSMAQDTQNIEGFNIDGTANRYRIIAADRSGNPVPNGTSINFVAEGGQVEAIKQIADVEGLARATANFVSSEPRPLDGRITLTAYALGEESFIDQNGNNLFDAAEAFQDLGSVFKDRNFDGVYQAGSDEFIPLNIGGTVGCLAPPVDLLRLNPSIPSVGGSSCDGIWSGAGQVYVRRAVETVLSTSAARPLWADTSGLDDQCKKITMQTGSDQTANRESKYVVVNGATWYTGAGVSAGALSLIVADRNPGFAIAGVNADNEWAGRLPRLNPMAAGTVISVSTPTNGLSLTLGGGSPVASTTEATSTAIGYEFTAATSGVVFVNFRSPSGTTTTSVINLQVGPRPSVCP